MLKRPVVRVMDEERGSLNPSTVTEEQAEFSSAQVTQKTGGFARDEESADSFNERKWAD